MNKGQATAEVNAYIGDVALNNGNTSFSNINAKKPVWWLNISPKKFENELHILLAKKNDSGLIWLRIKANTFPNLESVFRIRNTGDVDLEIACEGNRYMRDIKGHATYNFSRHIEHEWDE